MVIIAWYSVPRGVTSLTFFMMVVFMGFTSSRYDELFTMHDNLAVIAFHFQGRFLKDMEHCGNSFMIRNTVRIIAHDNVFDEFGNGQTYFIRDLILFNRVHGYVRA